MTLRNLSVSSTGGAFSWAGSSDPSGLVITSPDGMTWTAHSVTDIAGANRVRFIDGIFVACIGSPSTAFQTIVTSPDGLTWTAHTTTIQDGVFDVA